MEKLDELVTKPVNIPKPGTFLNEIPKPHSSETIDLAPEYLRFYESYEKVVGKPQLEEHSNYRDIVVNKSLT
jgi:hypothetical protein